MIDLEIKGEAPRFSEAKHYLGKLCIRRHDFNGTGKSWRHLGHRNCVECTRERAREWNKENPQRAAASTKRRDARRIKTNRRLVYPFAEVNGRLAKRARDQEIPHNLTPDDLRRLWVAQDGRCFWTGEPLDFNVGGDRHALRPSIDKLVPAGGYVVGNVVWSTNFANRARGDMPAAEFAALMKRFGFTCMDLTANAYDVKLAKAFDKFSA